MLAHALSAAVAASAMRRLHFGGTDIPCVLADHSKFCPGTQPRARHVATNDKSGGAFAGAPRSIAGAEAIPRRRLPPLASLAMLLRRRARQAIVAP
jgi:hypothetical protein